MINQEGLHLPSTWPREEDTNPCVVVLKCMHIDLPTRDDPPSAPLRRQPTYIQTPLFHVAASRSQRAARRPMTATNSALPLLDQLGQSEAQPTETSRKAPGLVTTIDLVRSRVVQCNSLPTKHLGSRGGGGGGVFFSPFPLRRKRALPTENHTDLAWLCVWEAARSFSPSPGKMWTQRQASVQALACENLSIVFNGLFSLPP